jgi:methylmalonyl-CoA mutase cobalamin-binding subunit
MARRVGRYLRTLFLINAGYGLTVAIGLAIIGVPGAIMWGVLGFSLRFLPYIGPWIAAVLPTLVAIATTDGWKTPILTAGWYIVVELIANNIVEPLVYGSSTGISTVGVIISAIFWTWLWGPIGLILAMPMTVCFLVAARYVPQLKFINTLLADQPAATPGERVYQHLLAFDDREPTKFALKHVKDSSLAGFYDDTLLPALVMFEHDRHAELLNDEQSAFVLEAVEDLVTDLGTSEYRAQEKQRAQDAKDGAATGNVVSGPATQPVRVLCIPLHDDADEIAARMLVQLLAAEGFQAESGAAESLTAELVEQVAESESDIVVISVLPPLTPRDSRLLWRRLRGRYPTLPIVVGFWTAAAQKEALAEPVEDAASKVATTLAEAVAFVRSMATQIKHTAKTA